MSKHSTAFKLVLHVEDLLHVWLNILIYSEFMLENCIVVIITTYSILIIIITDVWWLFSGCILFISVVVVAVVAVVVVGHVKRIKNEKE